MADKTTAKSTQGDMLERREMTLKYPSRRVQEWSPPTRSPPPSPPSPRNRTLIARSEPAVYHLFHLLCDSGAIRIADTDQLPLAIAVSRIKQERLHHVPIEFMQYSTIRFRTIYVAYQAASAAPGACVRKVYIKARSTPAQSSP